LLKTMSAKKSFNIEFNGKTYRVDAKIFCKMSSKFNALYQENQQKLKFDESVSPEVFIAFISSCQLKSFSIAPNKAQELLTVAREWGAPSLEQYATDVCKKEGIPYRPRVDPIGDLVAKQEQEKDTAEDYKRAATVFMDSLDDHLLREMDPEPLFRVVAYAEKLPNFDEKKFAEFVITLHKEAPESAVLLALRADFDNFLENGPVPEGYDILFKSPQMRSQSIGFFVAYAFSQMRHKCDKVLTETELKIKNALATFVYEEDKDLVAFTEQLKQAHSEEMARLNETYEKQDQEIQRLTKELTRTADILTTGSLSAGSINDPTLNTIIANTNQRIEKLYGEIQSKLKEKHDEHREQMKNDVMDQEQQWEDEYNNPEKVTSESRAKLETLFGVSEKYDETIAQIDTDLDNIRYAIYAKISDDYVRSDKALRDTSNLYSIFDGFREDVNKEGVENSAKFLKDISDALDKKCPLKSGSKK
jgi:hypothetical protein